MTGGVGEPWCSDNTGQQDAWFPVWWHSDIQGSERDGES